MTTEGLTLGELSSFMTTEGLTLGELSANINQTNLPRLPLFCHQRELSAPCVQTEGIKGFNL